MAEPEEVDKPPPRWGELTIKEQCLLVVTGCAMACALVAGLVLPVLAALLFGAKIWPSAVHLDGWPSAIVAAFGITFSSMLAEILTSPLRSRLQAMVPGLPGLVAAGLVQTLATAGTALICLRLTPGVSLYREEFVLVLGVVSAVADAVADWVSAKRD